MRVSTSPTAMPAEQAHPATPAGAAAVITPSTRRARMRDLVDQWEVVRQLTVRDLKSKYKQSILGPIWIVIQPLGLLVAFAVVFAGLLDIKTEGVPYLLFAAVGLTVWIFFQASISFAPGSLVMNLSIVRRVACPRVALPTAAVLASIPSVTLPLLTSLVLAFALGEAPTLRVLLLPVVAAWAFLLTWGIAILLSATIVHFRDVLFTIPFLLQAGLFLSPVAYPASRVENDLVDLIFTLNPLTGVIESFRWVMLPVPEPALATVLVSAVWTVGLVFGGWWVFRRLEPTMADFV